MLYHLSMIALSVVGIAGSIWASWRMHKSKVHAVGIVRKK